MIDPTLTPFLDAPQHGPRPLPLFLDLLRESTAANPSARARALAGLRAYQDAPRPPARPLKPAIATEGRARLRDYGGAGRPVVFIPSLINPPFVLDLAQGNSLLEWLATQGVRPMLVDWGTPDPADRDQDVTAHVEQLLLPLLRHVDPAPVLVGYCLGGTIALAAARALESPAVATIAAPWHFSGFPDRARAEIADLWRASQPACERLGLVPMEVLQSGFWRMDPARTVAKFERLADTDPTSPAFAAFVALEDWANGGAPLTYAAGRQMFEDFFAADRTGRGEWWVGAQRIRTADLLCPAVEFVSTTDRIVPAASAAGLSDLRPLTLGHVGMIVGSRARDALWQPLADWLTALPSPK